MFKKGFVFHRFLYLFLVAGLSCGVMGLRVSHSAESSGERLPGASQTLDLGDDGADGGETTSAPASEKGSGKAADPLAGTKRQEPSPWGMLLPMLIMVPVFYLLVMRPQSQQTKERQKMLSAIAPGDEVQLGGGILGTVQKLKDDHLVVQIAEGVSVRVRKDGVSVLRPKEQKGEKAAAKG